MGNTPISKLASTTPRRASSSQSTRPRSPSGPNVRPRSPSGPNARPGSPSGPSARPRSPSGPSARPRSPSGPEARGRLPSRPPGLSPWRPRSRSRSPAPHLVARSTRSPRSPSSAPVPSSALPPPPSPSAKGRLPRQLTIFKQDTRDPINNRDDRKAIDAENRFQRQTSEEEAMRNRGYTFGRLIGTGSVSKVYKVNYLDPSSTKKKSINLACKLLNGNNQNEYLIRHFLPREIDLLKRLRHTNIIQLHSVFQRNYRFFIFMQFCEGGDVLNYIRRNGALKEHQALIWFSQCLKGIHYLNEKRVAHRDIKCENLLLSSSFNIRITDFRFARQMGMAEIISDTYCGSMGYIAPEIIRGRSYDPRASDVWSLGVVLYVFLNKSLPFDDSGLKSLYDSQVQRKWVLKPSVSRALTEDAKNFIVEILQPDPMYRKYPSELYTHPWIQSAIASVGELTNTYIPRIWVKGTGFVDDQMPLLGKKPTQVFKEEFAPSRPSTRLRLESLAKIKSRVRSLLPDHRDITVMDPDVAPDGLSYMPLDPIRPHQLRYAIKNPPPRRTVVQSDMMPSLPEHFLNRQRKEKRSLNEYDPNQTITSTENQVDKTNRTMDPNTTESSRNVAAAAANDGSVDQTGSSDIHNDTSKNQPLGHNDENSI